MVKELSTRIKNRDYVVSILGLGYVGLPLALLFGNAGFRVIGFDINPERVNCLNKGISGITHIQDDDIAALRKDARFEATDKPERLVEADVLIIAVPTPLTRNREPDLSFLIDSIETVSSVLRKGCLVIVESTTWPGTTNEIVLPRLEQNGLRAGTDFFLAFSPEREDPGNMKFATSSIPKVVGADDEQSLELTCTLYREIVQSVVPLSSCSTAEAVKLTENIFRSVNIALVNELKVIYGEMGIDVWDVIEAAKSKPFGFMPFYPGPGLGGHCIPIDPFYLTWRAREYDVATRFIELAGEINASMPRHVVNKLASALDAHSQKGLNGSRILLIGMAYKANIDDMRESPSLKLTELLEERGAQVDYHDPLIETVPVTRAYPQLSGRQSKPLYREAISGYDVVLVSTDHDAVDWHLIAESARLIVDTRNIFDRKGLSSTKIIKA
ncbi:MAG: nucleotide sugar dehydrogenase [Alphaproteobacteria bacterium]